jgi:ribosomal protein S18 acetylase RimI-like enzyme
VTNIVTATERDVAAIVSLLEELDRYYGATTFEPAEEREKTVASLLFGDNPAAHVLLARTGSDAVGIATYSFLWPAAGVTRSLFLKELYVSQQYRGRGIGRALVRQVCGVAMASGCSRVDWTADRDNPLAEGFYRKLGAPVDATKLFYRLDFDGVRRLAS